MDWAHSARFKTHTFEQSPARSADRCRPHPTTAALRCPSATCWSEPNAWAQRSLEDGVLSLALPVQGLDPLHQLVDLEAHDPFRFLWDSAPGFA